MKRASLLLFISLVACYASAQDVSLDKKIGAENARMVEQEYGLYNHDSLYVLVNKVGNKLVSRLKSNPFEFRFFIADSPEPNAFALPGGYVYVTRGILTLIQTEDELAGIMAHEIIHVTQRHSVKQAKKGVLTGILKVPGNLLNAVTGTHLGNILNAPIDLSSKAFIAKYSRGHESESDEFGIQLAASAGYRPEALADALDRLSKEVVILTGEQERRSYFSDHPYTPQRVAAIRKSAPMFKPVNPSPVTPSHKSFISKFDGLCFGQNPQQGVFIDNVFVHPDLSFAWKVPADWQKSNNPTTVAAFSEKGNALVSLKVADPQMKPQELAEKAKEESKKNPGFKVQAAKDTLINGFPSFLLRIKSVEKNQAAIIELVWLEFNSKLSFQLVGMSTEANQKKINQTLCSLTQANAEQIGKVPLFQLKVVPARSKETIEAISQRTGNHLKADFTAVINNLDVKSELKEGDLFKVVTSDIYRPKR